MLLISKSFPACRKYELSRLRDVLPSAVAERTFLTSHKLGNSHSYEQLVLSSSVLGFTFLHKTHKILVLKMLLIPIYFLVQYLLLIETEAIHMNV
jgi:hypothetical protein